MVVGKDNVDKIEKEGNYKKKNRKGNYNKREKLAPTQIHFAATPREGFTASVSDVATPKHQSGLHGICT